MDLRVTTAVDSPGWSVSLLVSLDRQETSELFLAGDRLISWPLEGMVGAGSGAPLDRSSMFLSEIVSRPEGLQLKYETELQAEKTAQLLAFQVQSALDAG